MNSVTIRKGGMEMNKRGRERGAQGTGRVAPRLQAIHGASSFPRKREPTGGRPLRASGNLLEGASPTRKREPTPTAPRPDRSTLSRRVRGVLSPYRERGIRALARLGTGRSPVSPTPRRHVIPAQAGTYWRRLAYAQAGTYPSAPAYAQAGTYPNAARHSRESGNLPESRPPTRKRPPRPRP